MGERTDNVQPAEIGATLTELASVISARCEASPEKSYTARLLQGSADYALKKIVEEACEVTLACKDGDRAHIRYEAADLLYHLMVVLERYGIGIEDLAGELNARRGG